LAATTRGEGKLTYFIYFPCLLVEAALSIFNFSFKKETQFSEEELMKTKEISINAEA
jgi:hypothetical protein